jgi:hypothetical protein
MKSILRNGYYKWLMVGTIGLLLIINTYSVFVLHRYLSFVNITLLSIVLAFIFGNWKYQNIIIKIWSFFISLGGILGLFTATINLIAYFIKHESNLSITNLITNVILKLALLILGLFFFMNYKKNIITNSNQETQ